MRSECLLYLSSILFLFMSSCNNTALTFTEKLEIAMVGSFNQPPEATGNADPKVLVFTLMGGQVTLGGGAELNLFKDQEPLEFRIIARPQIILESDLSTYLDEEISSVSLTFAPTLGGVGKYSETLTATLTSPRPAYTTATKIQKGQTIRLLISALWKNTVTVDDSTKPPTETLSAPSLVIELKNRNQ